MNILKGENDDEQTIAATFEPKFDQMGEKKNRHLSRYAYTIESW